MLPPLPDRPDYSEELSILAEQKKSAAKGNTSPLLIGGGDEAGRGPLAGPVTAAIVILSADKIDSRINDSKKLSADLREELETVIKQNSIAWSVAHANEQEIDSFNILEAAKLAFVRAWQTLSVKPGFLLLDALTISQIPVRQKKLIKGDCRSVTIAAASILAKTARDRLMQQYAKQYPEYGFERHKGYPTPQHISAIKQLGVLPIHRQTFKRVKEQSREQKQ